MADKAIPLAVWQDGQWIRTAQQTRKRSGRTLTTDRTAKRELWLSRAWKRRADGCSVLYDGTFHIVVHFTGRSWGYTIRPAKGESESWAKTGFASAPTAKLAAFDKITRLLKRASLEAVSKSA